MQTCLFRNNKSSVLGWGTVRSCLFPGNSIMTKNVIIEFLLRNSIVTKNGTIEFLHRNSIMTRNAIIEFQYTHHSATVVL